MIKNFIKYFLGLIIFTGIGGAEWKEENSKNTGQACFTLRDNRWGVLYTSKDTNKYLNIENTYFQNSETSINNNQPAKNKTWIYTTEFVSAGTISVVLGGFLLYAGTCQNPPDDPVMFGVEYGLARMIGDVLVTAPVTWVVGKLMGEKGSLRNCMIGVGIGSALGTSFALTYRVLPVTDNDVVEYSRIGVMGALPPLGAVIGYNF